MEFSHPLPPVPKTTPWLLLIRLLLSTLSFHQYHKIHFYCHAELPKLVLVISYIRSGKLLRHHHCFDEGSFDLLSLALKPSPSWFLDVAIFFLQAEVEPTRQNKDKHQEFYKWLSWTENTQQTQTTLRFKLSVKAALDWKNVGIFHKSQLEGFVWSIQKTEKLTGTFSMGVVSEVLRVQTIDFV